MYVNTHICNYVCACMCVCGVRRHIHAYACYICMCGYVCVCVYVQVCTARMCVWNQSCDKVRYTDASVAHWFRRTLYTTWAFDIVWSNCNRVISAQRGCLYRGLGAGWCISGALAWEMPMACVKPPVCRYKCLHVYWYFMNVQVHNLIWFLCVCIRRV